MLTNGRGNGQVCVLFKHVEVLLSRKGYVHAMLDDCRLTIHLWFNSFTTGDHNDPKAVVIDNGSFVIKAGLAGDHAPLFCFRSAVGKGPVFGEDAIFSDAVCDYPMDRDTVTNWEDMEKVETKLGPLCDKYYTHN